MAYKIEINNLEKTLSYDLVPKTKIHIEKFSYTFENGKCYGLNLSDKKGWLISECFTGKIRNKNISLFMTEPEQKLLNRKDLMQISIPVGIPNNKCFYKYIKNKLNNEELEALIDDFGLSYQRIKRPLKKCGSERWRMGFALGEVLNKTIYCFPWISTDLLEMYSSLWLEEFIKKVKEKGGIVLIPTEVNKNNTSLFDCIIND